MANVPSKFHWDILKTRPKFRIVLREEEEEEELEATGPGAQLAIPSLTRIWLGDRDRE